MKKGLGEKHGESMKQAEDKHRRLQLCLDLNYVLGVLAAVCVVFIIFLVTWKYRKRKLKCGSVLCCSVKYEVHELPSKTSRDNPVYGHQNTESVAVEEVSAGCEIYQSQEEILNYDQKRILGLCSVHKSTQTISGTWIYENYLHHQTLDGLIRRRNRNGFNTCKLPMRCGKSVNMDYDYALNHGSNRSNDRLRSSVRRSRRHRTVQQAPKLPRDAPPPCGRERMASPSVDINDPIHYIDPNQCNSCLPGEDALSPESVPSSDVSSDSDDSGESDNRDSHKIAIDSILLEYVDTLKRNHGMYIQKYKTKNKNTNKRTSSWDNSTGQRKKPNTGVLKLLEMKTTKVCQTFSVPVNIEPVSLHPCHFSTPPIHHRKPPNCHRLPPRQQRPPPLSHTATTPRPCRGEEDYLKILS